MVPLRKPENHAISEAAIQHDSTLFEQHRQVMRTVEPWYSDSIDFDESGKSTGS
jgi:hypothetical protein